MIDLHCHSTVSDGMLSPAEVVRLAHQNGCTLLALTDHDHTGGIAEARAEADRLDLRLINGVEISVTWRGRTIHVVGLDFDERDENLQNLLAQVRQGRLKRLEAIAAKLEKKGIGGAYDGALALAVIAHPMRYDLSATAKRNLFEEFKNLGGAGIEVHSGNCCKNDRLNYALLAERFGLLASAGSDFHRLNDFSGGILGACPELPENCRPVWEHFSRH